MKIKYQRHPQIQIIKFFSQKLNLKIISSHINLKKGFINPVYSPVALLYLLGQKRKDEFVNQLYTTFFNIKEKTNVLATKGTLFSVNLYFNIYRGARRQNLSM